MKRIILILIGLFSFGFSFAYQQQGFENYNELNGFLNFQCSTQCFILLGPVSENDFININGNLKGNGMLGYGFLVGEQIYPGETIQINGGGNIDQKFTLSNSQIYSQIPGEAQLALLFQGNLIGNQIGINGGIMGVFDNIEQGRNDFWKFDTFKPYTINLLYGPKIFGKSANGIFYWIFILGSIVILFKFGWKNKKSIKSILILGFILWGIFDLRMFLEFTKYTTDNYNKWIKAPIEQKNYKDLYGNYPLFVDWTNEELDKIGQKSYVMHSDQERPFPGFFKYQIYPKKLVETGDVLIVRNSNIILSGNVVYYKNNEKSFQFKEIIKNPLFPNSFIFYK